MVNPKPYLIPPQVQTSDIPVFNSPTMAFDWLPHLFLDALYPAVPDFMVVFRPRTNRPFPFQLGFGSFLPLPAGVRLNLSTSSWGSAHSSYFQLGFGSLLLLPGGVRLSPSISRWGLSQTFHLQMRFAARIRITSNGQDGGPVKNIPLTFC